MATRQFLPFLECHLSNFEEQDLETYIAMSGNLATVRSTVSPKEVVGIKFKRGATIYIKEQTIIFDPDDLPRKKPKGTCPKCGSKMFRIGKA